MTPSAATTRPEQLEREAADISASLAAALRRLVEAIPGAPHRPTDLARQVDVNRVIASRLLNAVERTEASEILQRLPGPESLRAVARAAADFDIDGDHVLAANLEIERFAELIKRFGTRSALNAALSAQSEDAAAAFELASRYHVFNGMRQILGVEAETWLTSMMFVPNEDDPAFVDSIAVHGALGMRRLRPGVNVDFTFGPPDHDPERRLAAGAVDLSDLYKHTPAALETVDAGGRLVHRLADAGLGRDALVDMLAVSRHRRSSRRHSTPERPRHGCAIFVDVPVRTLIVDILLPDDVFAGAPAELLVYNPGARGPADPNDPQRDVDRIDVPERIEALGLEPSRYDLPEVPHYETMIARSCALVGRDPAGLRIHRVRMAYPVHGFQFVVAFTDPA